MITVLLCPPKTGCSSVKSFLNTLKNISFKEARVDNETELRKEIE